MTEDPDARIDEQSRSRLATIQHGYEDWTAKAGRAILVLIVFQVLTVAVLANLVVQNQRRSIEAQRNSHAAKKAAGDAKRALRALQEQRRRTVLESCARDNKQARANIAFIKQFKYPGLTKQARAAFPIEDCVEAADKATGSVGP